jgi:uncharacterized protein YjdB
MARIQLAAGYFVGLLLSASLLATCDAGFLVEPGAGADRLEVAGVSGLEVERDVVRVTAVVRDGAGLAISAGAVSWSSSDPAVVAIEAVTHREAELKALGPGVATITASYDDIAVFEFVEIQNRAVSLVPVSGSGQYAAPGALLPESLVVAIMDRHGAPVSGIDITFAVAEGGGAIFPATAQTDGAGRARAAWTLGSEGDQLARASAVPGQRRAQLLTDEAVAFAASVQLVAASITFEGAGGFDAEGDTVRLTAAVRDGQDRPITAGSVTWASSDPAVATVEPAGAREAVLVAHAPGTATITASYDDHAAAESVAVQNRANKLVRISGSGQSAPGGDRLPDALIAAVTDRKGDPVAGIDINFSVQSGGGSLSHPTARTDAAGEARTWWTIGTQGEQVVKARAAAGQKRAGPISNQVIEYEGTVHDPPPPPLGTLTVSPSGHGFAAIGEELLLSVEARAADGQILGDAEVTWASSNSEVASVDSNGRVIARGIGAAMIAASAVCCTSTFVPIDVDEASADPGRVTDLTATEVTTSTATLSFTQVDDGTGAPAQYLLRYRQAPYAHWGTANPVEAGSCAGSVAGTAVGQPLTCTVGGLEPGTSYGFQVIAFRGTFPGEAVFGELSDVTTASTQAADDGGPGSLTVTPSSHTFTAVGQELQLSVTARRSDGEIITEPSVTWSSSDSQVATVSDSGVLTARGAGFALITVASLCCGTATTDVRVEPAGDGELLFSSRWDHGVGTTQEYFSDGGRWNESHWCWSTREEVLNVVTGAPLNWSRTTNVLRVTQLGPTHCGAVQLNPSPLAARQSHWGRMYFRNDETTTGHWHPNTYNAVGSIQHVWWSRYANSEGVRIGMRPNLDVAGASLGYPRNGWFAGQPGVGIVRLPHGTWFRYEWHMEYLDAPPPAAFPDGAVFRFWPRIYNMSGELLYDHNNFFYLDSNGSAAQSLAAYYAAGGAFSVGDADLARRFGLGNEGPGGSNNSGESWYIADVALSLKGWIGH